MAEASEQLVNAVMASLEEASANSEWLEKTFSMPVQWQTQADKLTEDVMLGVVGIVKRESGGVLYDSGESDNGAILCSISDSGTVSVQNLGWLMKIMKVAPGWESIVGGPYLLDQMFGKSHTLTPQASVADVAFLKSMKTAESRIALTRADWAGDANVNLDSITLELEVLKTCTGVLPSSWLVSIEWENEFIDSQGRRAPPWRRSAGDLGYIRATTSEGKVLTILIHPEGLYEIKGMVTDEATGESGMDYDSVGSKFPSLCELLTTASKTFEECYSPQDYNAVVPPPVVVAAAVDEEVERSKPGGAREQALFERSMARAWQPAPQYSNYGFEADSCRGKSKIRFDDASKRQGDGTGSDGSDDDDDDNEEVDEFRYTSAADYPPEHWEIHKRMKYLSGGNQTATIIALCSLRDFDLTSPACQFAIKEKGLDLLINLLDTEESRCKIAALMILRDISQSSSIKHAVAELDGMKSMVRCLDDDNDNELRSLAAATIANCAQYSRNRRVIRKEGGIEKLVKLLLSPPDEDGSNEMARCGALALESCCQDSKIREIMLQADALPLFAQLIKSENIPLLIPVVGSLCECASQETFRKLIREAGIIPFFVKCLTIKTPVVQKTEGDKEGGEADSEDKAAEKAAANAEALEAKHALAQLKTHSAMAIFRCAEDSETATIIRNTNGLKPLVDLLQEFPENAALMSGVAGAIWKCAKDAECNTILVEAKACEFLVPLLTNQPEIVLMYAVGGLSELAAQSLDPSLPASLAKRRDASAINARKAIRSAGGIDHLVKLLTGTNQDLLINVTKAVGSCAADKENMATISRGDGVRLLWSLLKSPNPEVQAGAAWAICPCIEIAPDAPEMVRSFVGGLELIVGLLRSEHIEVLSSVCAAIASIARDNENLAVITDHSVVPMLSRLAETSDNRLRCQLAKAIGRCCSYASNRAAFGKANAVAPLVQYLKSKDALVHRETAKALSQLSMDADNCIIMHQIEVVKYLVPMMGSADIELQEAAAQCVYNIRRLALVNELTKHQ